MIKKIINQSLILAAVLLLLPAFAADSSASAFAAGRAPAGLIVRLVSFRVRGDDLRRLVADGWTSLAALNAMPEKSANVIDTNLGQADFDRMLRRAAAADRLSVSRDWTGAGDFDSLIGSAGDFDISAAAGEKDAPNRAVAFINYVEESGPDRDRRLIRTVYGIELDRVALFGGWTDARSGETTYVAVSLARAESPAKRDSPRLVAE